MSRKPYEKNDTDKERITGMALAGVNHEIIAKVMKMSRTTLYKYYRDDLDWAKASCNGMVANALFKNAFKENNTAAQIFWMKTQAGWRETNRVEHSLDESMLNPTTIELAGHVKDDEQGED